MIVSASISLIILTDLDKLNYLINIFEEVFIPYKVYEEIVYKGNAILPDFIKVKKVAKKLGIKIIGLLGILYLNYRKNFLEKSEIEKFLEDAINMGYRISNVLVEDFLKSLD